MGNKTPTKNGRSLTPKISANQLTTEERRAVGVRSAYQRKIKALWYYKPKYTKELSNTIASLRRHLRCAKDCYKKFRQQLNSYKTL